MVKYDETSNSFKYYDESGKHSLIDKVSYEESIKIINDLILCPEFQCDSTVLSVLYMSMRKLQGFSDEDIQRLMI